MCSEIPTLSIPPAGGSLHNNIHTYHSHAGFMWCSFSNYLGFCFFFHLYNYIKNIYIAVNAAAFSFCGFIPSSDKIRAENWMDASMDFKELLKGLLQQLINSNFIHNFHVTSTLSTQYHTLFLASEPGKNKSPKLSQLKLE